MGNIRNLLHRVEVIKKQNDAILDATGARFNIISLCGVAHNELMHSRILGEFLNPNGSHSLKNAFLDEFLKTLNSLSNNEEVIALDTEKSNLYLEYHVNRLGRIDILVEDGENALIIENKLYAQDQNQQLYRYDSFAKNNFKNYTIVYLTLDGHNASEQSCVNDESGVNYIKISYKETIVQWLEECVKHAIYHPLVRETLVQYINHLKTLTHQDMNAKNKEEVIEAMKSNIEASFVIANNIDNFKNHIINTEFLRQMHEVAEELKLKFVSKEGDYVNKYSGFLFEIPDTTNYNMRLEFQSRGLRNLIIGAILKSEDCDGSSFDKIKENYGTKGNDRWVAYRDFTEYQNWDSRAFVAILNGEMKKAIKNELEIILEVIKDAEGMKICSSVCE
ncbi:PDDEXK-like family protein [Ornithobacterium rhinotracheale]|uniref:PDDEXK-like family protein n=1 Tax=Ornithobacterium rhinotracheale TaxID=28251 RepID=UPI003FA4D15A